MKKFIFLLLMAALAGCAERQTPIPEPQAADAGVFAQRCGECHSLPHPKRHTYAQWDHMITVMDKERDHQGMAPLTGDERTAIMEYLKRHAR